ncbi:threonine--tRNA ligase [Candidatus Woesearchaeota archaeon]|nr:threonine--tRNA ligase [Candidatus Woesearchaeota archaeon]
MTKIKITLPDGSAKEYNRGITAGEIAFGIGKRLGEDALIASINGKLKDLFMPINEDSSLQIITYRDKEGVDAFRHSTAHLLAQAVVELFPDAKPTIGPAVEEGFYYDFDIAHHFIPEDLQKIEERMQEIVKKDFKVERVDLNEGEAKKLFKDNPYKIELIEEFHREKQPISAYKQGNFIDLCRGPHTPSTGKIKAFKLTNIAAAYWRGDSKKQQLQRIYGISFPEKGMLDSHLKLIEEAEKRDHRRIGKELEWFNFFEESPGAPFFYPKGTIIYNLLLNFIREEYRKRGYHEVITPLLYEKNLWITSGHWEHFREHMFTLQSEGKEFALKPMNCPSHVLIYKSKSRSYKDLPLRIADFAPLHRNELSGVLSGLTRVRKMSQDDAHIFLAPEQIEDEIFRVLDFVHHIYNEVFDFEFKVELSTRPEKFMGKIEDWNKAEEALKRALEKKKISYEIKEGEGAFYGPKIDFHIKDAIGRGWQLATIQLDFQLPERFDATYVGADNSKHGVVMIHRALIGSVERFMGILVEHYAGKLPLWLAPVQVKILTVADRFEKYADKIKEEFEKNNIRVDVDARTESLGYKVREAQLHKIPLVLTVGEKEEANNAVAVRTLDNKVYFDVKIEDFLSKVLRNIEEKKVKVEME